MVVNIFHVYTIHSVINSKIMQYCTYLWRSFRFDDPRTHHDHRHPCHPSHTTTHRHPCGVSTGLIVRYMQVGVGGGGLCENQYCMELFNRVISFNLS